MKVKDAINILNQMDQEAVLFWHDAIEGNDCEVCSFYPIGEKVFVSPWTKKQFDEF